jgi:hypothetical protein
VVPNQPPITFGRTMSFSNNGFELTDDFLTAEEIDRIKSELEQLTPSTPSAGIRNADKKFATIRSLITSRKFLDKAKQYLSGNPRIVRAILFDKTPDNNWLVTWHQDKTICVSEKKGITGWGPWTLKDGIHHVQPPLDILDQMVTLRIHLDDSTLKTGCLRVIPNSHLQGILSNQKIQEITKTQSAVNCIAKAGSILVMRPHLLHASSKAANPIQRRVIHVEYSNYELPDNLVWI